MENNSDRNTGRSTALMLMSLAQAISRRGDIVEFKDHDPMTELIAKYHADSLKNYAEKMGLSFDIVRGDNRVFIKANLPENNELTDLDNGQLLTVWSVEYVAPEEDRTFLEIFRSKEAAEAHIRERLSEYPSPEGRYYAEEQLLRG
jgi:hypothetical protein